MKLEIHPSFLALLKRQAAQNGISFEEFVEALLDEHMANTTLPILGGSFSDGSRSSSAEVEAACKDSDQGIFSCFNDWLGKSFLSSSLSSTNYLEWQPPACRRRSLRIEKKKAAKAELRSNTRGSTAYSEW